MQDRFKFRVWYKPYDDEHEMIYDAQATYDNRCNGTGSFYHCDFQEVLDDKNSIVMQCTGLKDKNGTLIYEGDVVKIKNEIFFIKYEIGSFLIIRNEQSLDAWYEMFTEAWNDDVYPLSQLYVDEYIQEEYIDCIEVIGNIYENKELLESEG